MRLMVIIFAAIFLSSMAHAEPKSAEPKWLISNIVGLSIALDDPQRIENLDLKDDGEVLMTIGRKHGDITGPAFDWRLTHGKLQLLDMTSVWQEFKIVSRDSQWIVVSDQDNKVLKFKIIKDADIINCPEVKPP